ncbi:MAG: lipid-A-disaccharide synthase [Synergistaceae bacterium]|nr:lipid-A-disaccharide synthase [Synergistaceae bacterium]
MSAGEVSGDHYAARLGTLLKERGFCGGIYGLCGAESREAGFEALWNNERLHVMGVAEVFSSLADILRLMGEICGNVMERRPDAMAVVDSPDFHLPLIRRLRRCGYRGKIFYISPPAVWAWRKYRAADLAKHVDICLPLFKFEHEYLLSKGCDSRWAGHPLVEDSRGWNYGPDAPLPRIEGPNAPERGDVLAALLPGSRLGEIKALYPTLSELASRLSNGGCRPVFSVAPGLSGRAREYLMSNVERDSHNYHDGPGRDIMAASSVVAGSSGTATAQALLLRRYMVVMYKVRPLSALIGKMLLKGVRFAIPNLLAGEVFYPELIQGDVNAENAEREMRRWLDMDPGAREKMTGRMDDLAALMGGGGAYGFWADQIMESM